MRSDAPLPYRTNGEDLVRFIESLARGRDLEQVQSLFSKMAYAGTLSAATELGFLDADTKGLTSRGRQVALGDASTKKRLFLEAILDYEPYELLLDAILGRGEVSQTELDWLETWWATNDYGSSQSNRAEAASSFARLIEFVGLGEYKQGRRGFATRIEWNGSALDQVGEAQRPELDETEVASEARAREGSETDVDTTAFQGTAIRAVSENQDDNSELSLRLAPDKMVYISVPTELTPQEKERLLSMLDLMILTRGNETSVAE